MSLAQLQDKFVGTIDFVGQKRASSILNQVSIFFSITSFLLGFVYQDIRFTVATFAFGIVVSLLLLVPPYPFYNKNNLTYLNFKNQSFTGASNLSETVIDIAKAEN